MLDFNRLRSGFASQQVENLTTRRYALISELNKLRQNDDINSCWSYGGRIFAKVHEDSEKTLIKDLNDIDLLQINAYLRVVRFS
jgi:hypothetical protein